MWRNLFDMGECTVVVVIDGQEYFSQVMGLGDEAPFAGLDEVNYNVLVDENGAVTLGTEQGAPEEGRTYQVNVVPSYAHDLPCRILDAQLHGDFTEATGIINADGDGLGYDTIIPAEPNPLVLTDIAQPRELLGLYAANTGLG